MIQLECPGCGELLELDRGFAGGICRCSNCGTLMTVPADASQQAEKLVRPDRPDRPGGARRPPPPPPPPPGAGAGAGMGAGAAERGGKAPPPPPPLPGGGQSRVAEETPGDARASEDHIDVYRTESGREVRIDRRRVIPTAQKRKVARYTTYMVFAAVVAAIVAVCLLAVFVLLEQQAMDRTASPVGVESFVYDPAANPFTRGEANVLGLPLRDRTVVVVDASQPSEAWLPDAEAAIAAGLVGHDPRGRVEVIYSTDHGLEALGGGMTRVASLSPEQFAALHERVGVGGDVSLVPAVRQALGLEPTHLVLVTGRRPTDEEVAVLRSVLAGTPALIVDIVVVDRETVALEDLSAEHRGRYVFLTTDRLREWRAAAAE